MTNLSERINKGTSAMVLRTNKDCHISNTICVGISTAKHHCKVFFISNSLQNSLLILQAETYLSGTYYLFFTLVIP